MGRIGSERRKASHMHLKIKSPPGLTADTVTVTVAPTLTQTHTVMLTLTLTFTLTLTSLVPFARTRWASARYWAADGIHPNDEGYRIWGEHIAQGVLESGTG